MLPGLMGMRTIHVLGIRRICKGLLRRSELC
jgi:hypothetical protein